ncbi:MAG: hypothetical protein EOO39_48995, partial [Cytophagaceae bacterium]
PDSLSTSVAFPLFKSLLVNLGWFYLAFGALVIVGASNAVNLTDGLDGLAIVPVIIAAVAFGVIAYMVGNFRYAEYLNLHFVRGVGEISVFCGALIGAGLGGGSADAAFTLRLLNEQFNLALSVAQLETYARQLGSDCAFFIQNRPLYCFEKGDRFQDIDVSLRGYTIVLVYPNLAISTAEAYASVRPRKPASSLRTLLQAPVGTWRNTIRNDFETSLFPIYPVLNTVKQELYQAGAVYASMSGSGSTIYGIFEQAVSLPAYFHSYQVWQKTI